MNEEVRLAAARARFFALHEEDPRVVDAATGETFETAYHARLERWVARLAPEAGPALLLAAMCQHVGRHALPRSDFPEGVLGYKKWRATQAQRHAAIAEEVLRETGWEEATSARVRELLTKKGLGRDPDVQLLEDAVCLSFLEGELGDFAAKHPEEKVADVLRKTWAKMSPAGHAAALAWVEQAAPALRELVTRALAPVP